MKREGFNNKYLKVNLMLLEFCPRFGLFRTPVSDLMAGLLPGLSAGLHSVSTVHALSHNVVSRYR